MSTEADIGHGTSIYLARPAAPTTWIELAEAFEASPPGLARDAVDATHFKSPQRAREYIGGMRDAGEVTIQMNYIPGSATDLLLLEAWADDVAWPMKIVYPNAAYVTMSQLITGYEPDDPMDDKQTATSTHKVSGVPTFTEAP